MDPLDFDGRLIGQGRAAYVIAEVGVNHNGRLDQALRLVEAAALAGADCVKFQTFSAERVASANAEKAPYQQITTASPGTQFEMLKTLELPDDAYPTILHACRKAGVTFLSTPYSHEDADLLDRLGVCGFKVASAQIVELEFLAFLAKKRKPIFLSTGMATWAEVDNAVRAIRETADARVILLQCTTEYPSPVNQANLRTIPTMRDTFQLHVGYSDHTIGASCCAAAIALGAVAIEKHFTLDKSLPGPDHVASAAPAEFAHLVSVVREVEQALGSGYKTPTEAELVNRPFMRRSIVARHAIPSGTVLTRDLLAFKRPGTGISPARLSDILGLRARASLRADELIQWRDLEHF